MNKDTEVRDPEQIHIDHEIRVQEVRGCDFVQRGVHMECDGNGSHSPHSFYIPPIYVFRGQTKEGLLFENMKTGEKMTRLPPLKEQR